MFEVQIKCIFKRIKILLNLVILLPLLFTFILLILIHILIHIKVILLINKNLVSAKTNKFSQIFILLRHAILLLN